MKDLVEALERRLARERAARRDAEARLTECRQAQDRLVLQRTEESAFDRFWRGDGTAAPGSGLGLAIVRATAERHGGRAWASGSTVTIALPVPESD